jgi:hypothetical protein
METVSDIIAAAAEERCHAGQPVRQAPGKESAKGNAGLATRYNRVLRSESEIPSENADVSQMRDWKVENGDVRNDPTIAREILEFIQEHGALSVAMSDGIMGCPHQEGIDYEGEWCPVCDFWRGRDRFTGKMLQ